MGDIMRLDDYKKKLDRNDYRGIINELIKEYYNFGVEKGYIDLTNSNKLKSFLREANFTFDISVKGTIMVQGKTIRVNPNNTFLKDCSIEESEKYASEVIYFLLSHPMNSFHSDYLANKKGLLNIFCDDFSRFVLDNYNIYMFKDTNMNNKNNIDKYSFSAVKLLDDVVSQNVSEDLLAYKYSYDREDKYKEYDYDYGIKYKSNFNSNGFFQEFGEGFARTFLDLSLDELSKLSFHSDAPLEILSANCKNGSNTVSLYKAFCCMGLMLYVEYYRQGRIKELPDENFIEDFYLILITIIHSHRFGDENNNSLFIDRTDRKIYFIK